MSKRADSWSRQAGKPRHSLGSRGGRAITSSALISASRTQPGASEGGLLGGLTGGLGGLAGGLAVGLVGGRSSGLLLAVCCRDMTVLTSCSTERIECNMDGSRGVRGYIWPCLREVTIWWEVGCLHEVFHRERVLRIVITRHVNVCQRA